MVMPLYMRAPAATCTQGSRMPYTAPISLRGGRNTVGIMPQNTPRQEASMVSGDTTRAAREAALFQYCVPLIHSLLHCVL